LIRIKKHLRNIKRVDNYSDRSKYKLNLDRNENIIGLSKFYQDKLAKYIFEKKLNHYPNLKNSYLALSSFLKIHRDNLLFTEGVSGAIKNIMDSLDIKKNSEIIYPEPSFALYKIYSKIYNLKSITYSYDKSLQLEYDKIFRLINRNTLIVFLPTPNIPIEGDIDLKKIKLLLKELSKKKIILALDEVYYPFGKQTYLSLIKKYDNLVVMRSFSKAYGLAGARIGYMISSKENIKIFNTVKGGYETNILSASTAEFILKNNHIVKDYVKSIKLGFKYFKKELEKMNLTSFGGINGNFALIQFDKKNIAKAVYKKLVQNKISVRYGFDKIFENSILVTLGPLKEMKLFIKTLKKVI
jgi:histidinol-phosphate aminotransferase